MFYEMRRKEQALPPEDCAAILREGTSGVLALSGEEGWPYAVPLSYVYEGGKLYFHCAQSGRKLDAVRRNGKASFCVIGQDRVVPEKYTTDYKSVIVFGVIRILGEEREKRAAMETLALKYAPDDDAAHREQVLDGWLSALCVLEMTVERMTGKQGKGLLKQDR